MDSQKWECCHSTASPLQFLFLFTFVTVIGEKMVTLQFVILSSLVRPFQRQPFAFPLSQVVAVLQQTLMNVLSFVFLVIPENKQPAGYSSSIDVPKIIYFIVVEQIFAFLKPLKHEHFKKWKP